MTSVTETFSVPLINARVVLTLAGTNGDPVEGFVSGQTVAGLISPPIAANGWQADLTPNSTITPSGTVWRRTVYADNLTPTVDYATVPAAGGPYTFDTILAAPPAVVAPTGAVARAGDTMTGPLAVPDAAYDATTWNGSAQVPTKNAVRDKIEALTGAYVPAPAPNTTVNLKDYVAADLVHGSTGVTTTGGSSTQFDDANANFLPGDVGKTIVINQAGHASNGISLVTTIAAWVSGTRVTLTSGALKAINPAYYAYGTDDTAGVNAAHVAAKVIAQASNNAIGYAKIKGEAKGCMVAGPLVTTNGYNSQIQVPYVDPAGSTHKIIIEFVGEGSIVTEYDQVGAVQPARCGTTLFSSLNTGAAFSASVGVPSCIGGPATGKTAQTFTNVHYIVRNIAIRGPHFPYAGGLDLGFCLQATVNNVRVDTNEAYADMAVSGWVQTGIIMPQAANNARCRLDDVIVMGRYVGVIPGEHTEGSGVVCYRDDIALGLLATTHAFHFDYLDTEWCKYMIAGVSFSGGEQTCAGAQGTIDLWDIEHASSGTYQTTYDIDDSSNLLRLDAKFALYKIGVTEGGFLLNGGHGVHVVDIRRQPGKPLAGAGLGSTDPKAIPASTVAQQNNYWRDAVLTIAGGTVTDISVDGVSTGLISGTVFLPSGKSWSITYSVVPTSVIWTLL